MVTALEDLVAQTAAQVGLTLEECTGELQGRDMKRKPHVREKKKDSSFRCYRCTWSLPDLLYKEPE